MKYPEHKLSMETALPSSVQSWLGNELEIRGIDSVIYSRYIIHLLLEEHDEEKNEYLELFFNPRLDLKTKFKSHKKLHSQEEKKKQAAVECLQAVSEENCGIENLVEELCNKLKELNQSSGSDDTDQGDSSPSLSESSCSELEDPAERYYAAFPALTVQHELEKSSNFDCLTKSLDVWRYNPWTKSLSEKKKSKIQKYKKESKGKDVKRKVKKKFSPNFGRKKHTSEKPIPKPKSKPNENFHARFMSWPQSDFLPPGFTDKQSSEEKKLCLQVENILKEMLLSGNEIKTKEIVDTHSESVSPELQENAFWYTNQFAELINPIESGFPLYERHSCPFFHNDDVFLDPPGEDKAETSQDSDQFGLHDLMNNQELQKVAESVLLNVDEDFSKKEFDEDISDKSCSEADGPFEIYHEPESLQGYEEKVIKPSLSPYDNPEENFTSPFVNEHNSVDLWSVLINDGYQESQSWADEHHDQDNFNIPSVDSCLEPEVVHSNNDLQVNPLPSWMYSGGQVDLEDTQPDNNGTYSQLWDINIWNRNHNNLNKDNRSFLDGFNTEYDDFKSGLDPLPDRPFNTSNRNSGIFNINIMNEELESFELFGGGNMNTLLPMITFDAVDCHIPKEIHEENSKGRVYDRSISLTDVHLLKSMRDHHLSSKDKLSKSYELIPSNNSAFKDVVPRKITHVKSDSSIFCINYSTLVDFDDDLIKPSSENEEKEVNENLYLSPKTHFRPISALAEDDISDLHLQDLFGGYSSSRTPYQKYQDTVDSGDEESFVPMFKVCKQHDKYIQTGTSTEEQPVNEEKLSLEDKGRPPEVEEKKESEMDLEFNQDFDVYGYIDSLTASAQNTPQNVLDVACNTCCDSGYEEANDDEKLVDEKSNWLTVKENYKRNRMKLPRQKSEETDKNDMWVVNDCENVGEISCSIPDNIWSCNDDASFPDMFSFFTDDCDDLKTQEVKENHPPLSVFETIPSLIDDSGHTMENSSNDMNEDVTKVKLVIGNGKKVLQDIENCSRNNTSSEPIYVKGYMPMPRVAVYSCELEKEWLDKESPHSYGKYSKSFKGTSRKPCTFFMEGSCMRSDCKFSHDLSTITCRFWEEGDCFKGDFCPFLHSYYVSEIPVDIKENVNDHFEFQEEEFPQLQNSSKKQKQKTSKAEKSTVYVESRKIYRTDAQKTSDKLPEEREN